LAGFEGILYISLLILFAKLFEEVAVRLHQPPIVGYIIAGIVLGPAVLAWVQPADEITLFIQIGVFFLFFLIGLEEIDIPSIFSVLRKRLFAGATVGFVVPFALAVPALFFFTDLETTPLLAVASVVGISSLGVVAKILMDYGKLKEPLGLEIFTLTAVLEFIGIIIASVFIQLASPTSFVQTLDVFVSPFLGGTNVTSSVPSSTITLPVPALPGIPAGSQIGGELTFDALSFAWLFIRMVIFFSAVTLFGLRGLPYLMRFVRSHLKVREIYFGMFVGIILLVSYFAEASGIHGAIGALLLGVLFSQMPKKDYEDTVKGLHSIAYGVFIPIFFAGIGIYFSFGFLSLPYFLIAVVLAVITVGKFGGAILAAVVAKLKPVLTVGTGVMAKGAVDLAILLSLLSAGIIQPDLFSLVVFGIVIMILATSITLKKRIVLGSAAAGKVAKEVSIETATDTLTPLYTRTVLGDLRVMDVYTKSPPVVYGDTTIRQFADKHKEQYNPAYITITKNDNSYLGIVTPSQLRKIRRENWERAIVNDISMQHVRAVKMGEPLYEVVEYMALHDFDLLAVLSDDEKQVVGGVMRKDILKYISKI
jgi:Kef-type K+ transport system membrane component KefB